MNKRILCEACHRSFYDSVVRECPKKPGHFICAYCCKKCKHRERVGTMNGCKAWERKKKEVKAR